MMAKVCWMHFQTSQYFNITKQTFEKTCKKCDRWKALVFIGISNISLIEIFSTFKRSNLSRKITTISHDWIQNFNFLRYFIDLSLSFCFFNSYFYIKTTNIIIINFYENLVILEKSSVKKIGILFVVIPTLIKLKQK